MAIISITITESEEQIVSGIPKTIALSTNVPALIFYTLDGSDPNTFSTQYVSPIFLSTSELNVILKVFASDGVDSSAIITETYFTNIINNTRLAHSATTAQAQENIPDLYPFGNAPIQPNAEFLNSADAGITVNNTALPSTATGFDGAGNPTGFTNEPYNLENYSIRYTETDYQNKPGLGVGNLPANVIIELPQSIPEATEQSSNMFNPRALVIFQDTSLDNQNDPPNINRMSFSLENPEKSRDGNSFYTSGLDAPPNSGAFVRSHYNPRTNEITYYYYDSWNNRWIISTQPYIQTGTWDGNMAGMSAAGGGAGARYVYEWIPYSHRVLF